MSKRFGIGALVLLAIFMSEAAICSQKILIGGVHNDTYDKLKNALAARAKAQKLVYASEGYDEASRKDLEWLVGDMANIVGLEDNDALMLVAGLSIYRAEHKLIDTDFKDSDRIRQANHYRSLAVDGFLMVPPMAEVLLKNRDKYPKILRHFEAYEFFESIRKKDLDHLKSELAKVNVGLWTKDPQKKGADFASWRDPDPQFENEWIQFSRSLIEETWKKLEKQTQYERRTLEDFLKNPGSKESLVFLNHIKVDVRNTRMREGIRRALALGEKRGLDVYILVGSAHVSGIKSAGEFSKTYGEAESDCVDWSQEEGQMLKPHCLEKIRGELKAALNFVESVPLP